MMYIFEYKELIKNLVISDLKTKYTGSMLGFAWSMLNPLLMMLVLYFVFSNIFKNQENFVVYLLTGIFAWRFFAIGTTSAMGSIVGKSSLVTKIYIPREILTLSVAVSSLVSSVLEFLVLIPLLIILGAGIPATVLMFPVIHLMYFLIVYGICLILASLYVYYRDLNQIWDVVLQVGFFLSPIIYPLSLVPAKYEFYYSLNPITRLINMYRDILLNGTIPAISDFVIVLLSGLMLFSIGTVLFKKLSRRFAEEV
ncbi:ABC-2 type transporter [uncultured archaeon]|nr:ABC-2 type transporter [uncultured archaeon]